ncbi:MAG: DUF433 domain-containing protein [Phycisphaerae bacterium]|nr:DUF433 domain-containing protein [Phycisphaerae bacterium]
MEWQLHITADPAVLMGKPVIKGTRISVELVLECLGRGWTIDDILRQYPHLTREGVTACVDYALDLVKSETVSAIRT